MSSATPRLPEDFRACNDLAWFYADRGQNMNVALELALKAERLSPENPFVLDTLGWIDLKMGKIDSSIDRFVKATSLCKDNPSIRYHLALALHKMGDLKRALSEIKQALSAIKDFPEKEEGQALLIKIREKMKTDKAD